VDWQIGEEIVIASTSYNHSDAERKILVSIDATGKVLTVDTPFVNVHLGTIEAVDSDSLKLRAEVGLLTRNVLIRGADGSSSTNYGGHILMHGTADDGLVSRIEFIEMAFCGQGPVVGRHCIYYQQNGDLQDSYLRGNSFHDALSSLIVLQSVRNLAVSWNVGYRSLGHSFHMQDGTETSNTIEYNLMMGTMTSWYMTELPATYLIRHPSNIFRWNRAAGSDAYGVSYMLDDSTQGLDALVEICPSGNTIGELSNSVIHSNIMTGLRIKKLISRTNPCSAERQEGLTDIWSINPSIRNTISNMTLFKNKDKGLLVQDIGNTAFVNFTVADSGSINIIFLDANYSK
jgi:hypothetical protein